MIDISPLMTLTSIGSSSMPVCLNTRPTEVNDDDSLPGDRAFTLNFRTKCAQIQVNCGSTGNRTCVRHPQPDASSVESRFSMFDSRLAVSLNLPRGLIAAKRLSHRKPRPGRSNAGRGFCLTPAEHSPRSSGLNLFGDPRRSFGVQPLHGFKIISECLNVFHGFIWPRSLDRPFTLVVH
jgi:hypothetical protein